MDFFKNNWGFLVLVVILLGGVVTLAVLCSSSASKLMTERDEVKKKIDYIDSVSKKHIELDEENVKVAKRNEREVNKGLKAMQEDLKNKFKLEVEVPATPIEGLRKLRDELEALGKKLDDNNIAYTNEYFTFENFARATNPPHPDDLREIFRQLLIVKYVVEVAIKAEVSSIDDLQRPMGLTVQDEGAYNFTPIEITIGASPQNAQNFINLMSKADKYLFFLRYLELTAADTPTSVADIHDEAINATGGAMGGGPMGGGRMDRGGMMADFGGMPGEGGRGRGRRRGADAGMAGDPGMMGGPNPGMMGGPNMGNQVAEEPLKRQDLLAYEPKETVWKLRYDFIEFAQDENSESSDEGAEDDSESSEDDGDDNAEQAD